ncbi:MAG TPA: carboxypeptidase-like regulatory domain-containing protein [Kofleriaceae bacterium]|nr:carboxypeptidase-like regulatory domain-containing protein [Kofleriaceae bacterium]
MIAARGSRARWGIALAVLGLAVWWLARRDADPPAPAAAPTAAVSRAAVPGLAQAVTRARHAGGPLARTGTVTLTGRVTDLAARAPIGHVEVVLENDAGEASAITGDDGRYTIDVAAGVYRAFVRDDGVLSVGRTAPARLPEPPAPGAAGTPDETVMTRVVAEHDLDGVDLGVVRGGVIDGRVVDRAGRPVAGAVIRAVRGDLRPALGTDIAESAPDGSFELRLPTGVFALEIHHPQLAGAAAVTGAAVRLDAHHQAFITVSAGDHLSTTLTLTAGCVITGRVVRGDGRPAGEGAIERRIGPDADDFAPVGKIAADGTFRWTTADPGYVQLRAWPWQSARSDVHAFLCDDGRRFDDVTLTIFDEPPTLTGTLVDATGAPVANAYIDIDPAEPRLIKDGQQERTDGNGRWAVHHLPPGAYVVSAQVEGLGVAVVEVSAPASQVRIALGGTGRLTGRVPGLGDRASFVFLPGTCRLNGRVMVLAPSARAVPVVGERFVIDDVPACELTFHAVIDGEQWSVTQPVIAGQPAMPILDRRGPLEGLAEDGLPGTPSIGTGVAIDGLDPEDTDSGDDQPAPDDSPADRPADPPDEQDDRG